MIINLRKKIFGLFLYLGFLVIFLPATKPLFATTNNRAYFLSMADIHFDPFLSCKNRIPCPLIETLQRAPSNQWNTILAKQNTNAILYKKDTNYRLLKSALGSFKKAAFLKHPRFVLVLGDLLAHGYQERFAQFSGDKTFKGYESFVKKSMKFLASEIDAIFPTTEVYYIVGNHDSYHNNYSSYPNGQFFKDMASIWSKLIKDKNTQKIMKQRFPSCGYYAIDLPGHPNLRLIVLNSVLFSRDAAGEEIANAAEKELNWLHKQLNTTHINQQHAVIALHIPVGINIYSSLKSKPFKIIEQWQPKYTSRFLIELQKYATEISAILPGHLHMDWFQVYSTNNGQNIPIIGTPAISSILGNNPAFKMFNYDTQSFQLENFITYSYSFNTNSWSEEYHFNSIYQPTCKQCEITNSMNATQTNEDLADDYRKFFAVGKKSFLISQFWMPYIWCNLHALTIKEYQTCLTSNQLHKKVKINIRRE